MLCLAYRFSTEGRSSWLAETQENQIFSVPQKFPIFEGFVVIVVIEKQVIDFKVIKETKDL